MVLYFLLGVLVHPHTSTQAYFELSNRGLGSVAVQTAPQCNKTTRTKMNVHSFLHRGHVFWGLSVINSQWRHASSRCGGDAWMPALWQAVFWERVVHEWVSACLQVTSNSDLPWLGQIISTTCIGLYISLGTPNVLTFPPRERLKIFHRNSQYQPIVPCLSRSVITLIKAYQAVIGEHLSFFGNQHYSRSSLAARAALQERKVHK